MFTFAMLPESDSNFQLQECKSAISIQAYAKQIKYYLTTNKDKIRRNTGLSLGDFEHFDSLANSLKNIQIKLCHEAGKNFFVIQGRPSIDDVEKIREFVDICYSFKLPMLITQIDFNKMHAFQKEIDLRQQKIADACAGIKDEKGKKIFRQLMKLPFSDKLLKNNDLIRDYINNLKNEQIRFFLEDIINSLHPKGLLSETMVESLRDSSKVQAITFLYQTHSKETFVNLVQRMQNNREFANHIYALHANKLMNKDTLLLLNSNTPYFAEALKTLYQANGDKTQLVDKWLELIEPHGKNEEKQIFLATVKLYEQDKLTAETLAFLRHIEPEEVMEQQNGEFDLVVSPSFPRERAYHFAQDILQKCLVTRGQSQSPLAIDTSTRTPSPPASAISDIKSESPPSMGLSSPSTTFIPSYATEPKASREEKSVLNVSELDGTKLTETIKSHRSHFRTITKKQFEDALAKYESRRGKYMRVMRQSDVTASFIRKLKEEFKLRDIYVCTRTEREYLKPKPKFAYLGKHLSFFNNKQKAFSQALMLEIAPVMGVAVRR